VHGQGHRVPCLRAAPVPVEADRERDVEGVDEGLNGRRVLLDVDGQHDEAGFGVANGVPVHERVLVATRGTVGAGEDDPDGLSAVGGEVEQAPSSR
jgi:hypothetical protein